MARAEEERLCPSVAVKDDDGFSDRSQRPGDGKAFAKKGKGTRAVVALTRQPRQGYELRNWASAQFLTIHSHALLQEPLGATFIVLKLCRACQIVQHGSAWARAGRAWRLVQATVRSPTGSANKSAGRGSRSGN